MQVPCLADTLPWGDDDDSEKDARMLEHFLITPVEKPDLCYRVHMLHELIRCGWKPFDRGDEQIARLQSVTVEAIDCCSTWSLEQRAILCSMLAQQWPVLLRPEQNDQSGPDYPG